MPDMKELNLILRAGNPIILVESDEEARVLDLFDRAQSEMGLPVFKWSVTQGLCRMAPGFAPQKFNAQPSEVLRHIRSVTKPGIFLLLDFHPFLEDPILVRTLREIALHFDKMPNRVVLLSPRLEVPAELRSLTARFSLKAPNKDVIQDVLDELVMEWNTLNSDPVEIDQKALDLLKRSLQGLTLTDAKRLARTAIFDDGVISESDIHAVQKAKYDLLDRMGVLHYEFETARFAEVGGLPNLKAWLELRRKVFLGEQALAVDPPKGILLLGVQGCGKSLAAKAVAGVWGVPLLRLDCGSLYNKYYGETERNLRESLSSADTMAPCVLWVDEIEKGISGDGDDGGVSKRVLGTLLTWMAERKSSVFLVATANDIAALPPELMRKGRFDEIFFVDLPDMETRAEILSIHLQKRNLDLTQFDFLMLAQLSEGFSGAELEQVVVGAMYASMGSGQPLTTMTLFDQMQKTRPLSLIMAEKIGALREWASTRTVPA
ncbi:MAG: AAA family ATPase [Acidobacteria bacterium]|nr:AAA family ATPase [Acidobacteriota bacterium]MCB9398612.1 AAA family ATPase [Acidobacteriota bacterium]